MSYAALRYGLVIRAEDDEDVVFSNHPVRAVNGNRVTLGDGFVSDEQMSNLRITHQRGVIEFNDE